MFMLSTKDKIWKMQPWIMKKMSTYCIGIFLFLLSPNIATITDIDVVVTCMVTSRRKERNQYMSICKFNITFTSIFVLPYHILNMYTYVRRN